MRNETKIEVFPCDCGGSVTETVNINATLSYVKPPHVKELLSIKDVSLPERWAQL